MKPWNRILLLVAVPAILLSFGVSGPAPGQQGKGKQGGGPAMKADREVFHFLLDNRKDIRRSVKKLDDGVSTVTESDRAEVAIKIQEHVAAMHRRVKNGQGIHLRDPLFAEIFQHYDKVSMKVEKTAKGVKVTETSTDPYVAKLIQAHADVVSKFIETGHEEVRRNHALPVKGPAKE
jgi:hypothetical protein